MITTSELLDFKKTCKEWKGGLSSGIITFTTNNNLKGYIEYITTKRKNLYSEYSNSQVIGYAINYI